MVTSGARLSLSTASTGLSPAVRIARKGERYDSRPAKVPVPARAAAAARLRFRAGRRGEENPAMAARSIWTGSISFGLVSVPVRMFSATESKELRFHFLDKRDLTPIGYDKVRRDTGEHVDNEEIVRGFEVEKGRFVPLEDEDLDRLD